MFYEYKYSSGWASTLLLGCAVVRDCAVSDRATVLMPTTGNVYFSCVE